MPLMRYFGFVGSALVLWLIAMGWFFPQPVQEQIRNDTELPTIRISSVERAPERVIIDTSLPTIVPPKENFAPSTVAMESAQQWLEHQHELANLNAAPNPVAPKVVSEIPKTKHIARSEPKRKVVIHPPLNIAPAPTYSVQRDAPGTRMSLLETLKERLGQTLFKLN